MPEIVLPEHAYTRDYRAAQDHEPALTPEQVQANIAAATGGGAQSPQGEKPTQAPTPGVPGSVLPPGQQLDQAAQSRAEEGFMTRLGAAAATGGKRALEDLDASVKAMHGETAEGGPAQDFETALTWADLTHPGAALPKAVYQLAHGAPVLAGGLLGGMAGGATPVPGGALAGGAIGAGAVSAVQSLGPYYTAALRANPNEPDKAFDQALKQAGTEGVFSAAGWAAFGFKPFASAVKNLLTQAFVVQPGVSAASRVAQNIEEDRPAGEGVAAGYPGAVVGTALPVAGHAILRGILARAGRERGVELPNAEQDQAPSTDTGPLKAPEAGVEAEPAQQSTGYDPSRGFGDLESLGDLYEGGKAPGKGAAPEAAAAAAAPEERVVSDQGSPQITEEMKPAEPATQYPGVTLGGKSVEEAAADPAVHEQVRQYLDGEVDESGNTYANPLQGSLQQFIDTPNQGEFIQRIAQAIPRPGVERDAAVAALARSLAMQPDELLRTGLAGSLPGAKEVLAWKMLVDAAGAEMNQAAKAYSIEPTPENLQAFTHTWALGNHLVGEWTMKGTLQGRAFRARSAAAHALKEPINLFQQMREEAGRRGVSFDEPKPQTSAEAEQGPQEVAQPQGLTPEIAREVAGKMAALEEHQVTPFVSALRRMTSRDALTFGWMNCLLTPRVVFKKLASDTGSALMNISARKTAEFMPGSRVAPGEAAVLGSGIVGAFGDGARAAWKALKNGQSSYMRERDAMYDVEPTANEDYLDRPDVMGALKDPQAGNPQTPLRNALGYLRAAIPTSWIASVDDFANAIFYRGNAKALLYRDGWEKGLRDEALGDYIDQQTDNMPYWVHEQAKAEAMNWTFKDPLSGFASAISAAANEASLPIGNKGFELPVGRFILPFTKIPSNIMARAYHWSPLPLAFPSDYVRGEFAAGGSRRAIMMAKIGLGTSFCLAGVGLSMADRITGRGPNQPELREAWQAGHQPYSVRFGDKWYSYRAIEPFGLMLGVIADTADIFRFAPEEDYSDLAASAVIGVGNAIMSASYLYGLADFFDSMHDTEKGADFFRKFAASAVPNAVASVAQAEDPFIRTHYNLLDAWSARIPGKSQDVPALQTRWGEDIPAKEAWLPGMSGHMATLLSPVTYTPTEWRNPIDKWIWENRKAFPEGEEGKLGISKPGKTQNFGGVSIQLTPAAHARLIKLAGNLLPVGNTDLGAKDFLNTLVAGNCPDETVQRQWDRSTETGKAVIVQSVYRAQKEAAKAWLLREYPDIGAKVEAQQQINVQKLTGTGP